jgi:hypothetical protein
VPPHHNVNDPDSQVYYTASLRSYRKHLRECHPGYVSPPLSIAKKSASPLQHDEVPRTQSSSGTGGFPCFSGCEAAFFSREEAYIHGVHEHAYQPATEAILTESEYVPKFMFVRLEFKLYLSCQPEIECDSSLVSLTIGISCFLSDTDGQISLTY